MSMSLSQMNQTEWPRNSYRLDIWEDKRWSWPVGTRSEPRHPGLVRD